ncbi:MAG: helix-turn-helix transcriptional regulator [Bryobacteraceae bacterium]|nr:helix-turn-helix transcriptional regulator [Bryobacteraceae bacterium]
MREAGRKLKECRQRLNMTYRDVVEASRKIAERRGNPEFSIPLSRLADIENKGVVPSIYRLYTLSAVYRLDPDELLRWYGVEREDLAADAASIATPATALVQFEAEPAPDTPVPDQPEKAPDLRRTTHLSRLLRTWGTMPLAMLKGLEWKRYRYGFIGTEDWFMYPLIAPGSLVLIDEGRKRIASGGWTGEFDRPVYFFETRGGYVCGWATLAGGQLILQPHPASRCAARVFAYPAEIEVIGRVTGVAMRLDLSARRRARF